MSLCYSTATNCRCCPPPLTNIKRLPHCDQNVPPKDQRRMGVPKHRQYFGGNAPTSRPALCVQVPASLWGSTGGQQGAEDPHFSSTCRVSHWSLSRRMEVAGVGATPWRRGCNTQPLGGTFREKPGPGCGRRRSLRFHAGPCQ